jgi:hypothetical protein
MIALAFVGGVIGGAAGFVSGWHGVVWLIVGMAWMAALDVIAEARA